MPLPGTRENGIPTNPKAKAVPGLSGYPGAHEHVLSSMNTKLAQNFQADTLRTIQADVTLSRDSQLRGPSASEPVCTFKCLSPGGSVASSVSRVPRGNGHRPAGWIQVSPPPQGQRWHGEGERAHAD